MASNNSASEINDVVRNDSDVLRVLLSFDDPNISDCDVDDHPDISCDNVCGAENEEYEVGVQFEEVVVDSARTCRRNCFHQ